MSLVPSGYDESVRAGQRAAVFADLLALPEDVRAEILDGEIVGMPSHTPEHGRVQSSLCAFAGPFDQGHGRGGPGGWWIAVEVDVRLGERNVVRPDVAGWRRERMPSLRVPRPVTVVPDWICEVVSPANPAHDRVRKRRIYSAHGVDHYWIVDPTARTLEALHLDRERAEWRETGAYDDESVARIAPFEAVELEVGGLFLPVDR